MGAADATCTPSKLGRPRMHDWRVIGFNPGDGLTNDHVHISCRRCERWMVTEVITSDL